MRRCGKKNALFCRNRAEAISVPPSRRARFGHFILQRRGLLRCNNDISESQQVSVAKRLYQGYASFIPASGGFGFRSLALKSGLRLPTEDRSAGHNEQWRLHANAR